MRLFDAYLAVDWSANSKPTPIRKSRDAVWVGERIIDSNLGISISSEDYFRTRWDCLNHLSSRLREHTAVDRKVFLGFDFAYGYPAGFAEVLGLHGDEPPWRLIWNELDHRIEDNEDNSNNRFVVAGELNMRCQGAAFGPYWGCPKDRQYLRLSSKSPGFPFRLESGLVLEAKRETEHRLPKTQSSWKLWTSGNVGSQTLLGIPAVEGLRDDPEFKHFSHVWPFETGFDLGPVPPGTPFILHAEIWPGVVNDRLDPTLAIRDQAQVRAMVEWLATLDAENELLPLFGRPAALSDDQLQTIVEQEGWILGSGRQNGAGA
jgi:precorrin-8X/cobalt-precorrin-8 methylmutase